MKRRMVSLLVLAMFTVSGPLSVQAIMFDWAYSGSHSKEYYEQAAEWERQKQERAAQEAFRHQQEITDQMGYDLWMSASETSRNNTAKSSSGSSSRYSPRSHVRKSKLDTFLSVVVGAYSYFSDRKAAKTAKTKTSSPPAAPSAEIQAKNKALTYSEQGFDFYKHKNYDQAITNYTQAIALAPQNAHYWEMRAGSYLGKKDYPKAIADYSQLIALKPEAFSYSRRGHAYYEAGDYDRAIADFTQVLALKPGDQPALEMRNLAYKAKEEEKQLAAKDTAMKQAEKTAQTANDYAQLAFHAYQKKDYDQAVIQYSEAIKRAPDDAYYWNMRASSYKNKNEYPKAIADYSQAIRLEPDSYNYFERGVAYYDADDYDKAIADFTQALNIEADDTTTLSMRALAYERKGDYSHAAADYKKVLQLDPGDTDAKEALERIKKK